MNRSRLDRYLDAYTDDPKSFGRLLITVQSITFFGLIGIAVLIAGNKSASLTLAAVVAACALLTALGVFWPGQIVTPLSILAISALFMYEGSGSHDVATIGLVAGIVIAGLFLGTRGLMISGVLAIAIFSSFIAAEITNNFQPVVHENTLQEDLAAFIIMIASISLSLSALINRLRFIADRARQNELAQITANDELLRLQKTLENRVTERTAELERHAYQMDAIATTARSITAMQNIEQLLPVICQVVSEQFGFYHTGIFLLDERAEYAVLRAANSEGGQRMLARGHRLRVGVSGIVGMAAGAGETRVALDVGADAVYFNNPDLPDTRSEMALPLKIGGQTIGVLDVQSREMDAFSEEDIAVLGVLANQVAVAIQNARLFSQTSQALAESQAVYQQYVANDWERFSRSAKNSGYSYDGSRVIPLERESVRPAIGSVSLPIRLRGMTIGNVILQSPNPSRQWTQEEINLARAAAERAGLAIENYRLLTEAQRRASKERAISEITGRIGSFTNAREIMQAAVDELGRALNGAEITLQFQTPDEN